MVKLFGFKLNETSAVLIFIFAILLLIAGGMAFYSTLSNYNQTGTIAPAYFIASLFVVFGALYMILKSTQQRNRK